MNKRDNIPHWLHLYTLQRHTHTRILTLAHTHTAKCILMQTRRKKYMEKLKKVISVSVLGYIFVSTSLVMNEKSV